MNKKRKSRKKNIIFIVIDLIILIALFSGISKTNASKNIEKVKYNVFVQALEGKKVETVSINSNAGTISYKLKDDTKIYSTNYPYTDDFVEKVLLADSDVSIVKPNAVVTIIKQSIPSLLTIGLFFGLIMIFTGRGAKEKEEFISTTKFSDVAGLEEEKEELLLLAKMMKDEKYRKSGARIPKGILFEGPPGNGKTLLARAFAGETGVNFIAINASDMSSPFVGVGSMGIKSVFRKARKQAPCVVFIDEIDAVGARRSGHDDSASKEMNSILTTLLSQMDGFTPTDDIIVIAATNRADALDEALVRPGRFDRRIVINLPDRATREALFKLYTKKTKCKFNVDFDKLANKTYGFSSSEIECIVNEAVINCLKNKSNEDEMIITDTDFENAILSLSLKGHIKKNNSRNEEDTRIVAYHEAGHAVVSYFATSKKVSTISIAPTTSGAGGFTVSDFDDDRCLYPIEEMFGQLKTLYAGRAAEYILGGGLNAVSAGASNDISEATKLAVNYNELKQGIDHSVFGEYGIKNVISDAETVLENAWKESLALVEKKWDYVKAVAGVLIEKETLDADEFENIMSSVKTNEKEKETN